MKRCPQKKNRFPQKNWISLLNSAGIHLKTASVPAYNNLYHYAGNNPVRYIDPDGRETGDDYDIIEDTAKGFKLAYDVWENTTPENFPNASTKAFENHVNEEPLFLAFAAGAGALVGGGYALYNSVSWINDLVSIFEYEYRITNNYLLENGIDVFNKTLTFKNHKSNITQSYNFTGSSISSENIKLKTLSIMSIPINDDTTFSLKLSCCLNFYFSNCKEKTRFDIYKATLCITIKN